MAFVALSAVEAVPAGQSAQEEALAAGPKLPAAQGWQAPPAPAEKKPAAHAAHAAAELELEGELLPAGQGEQATVGADAFTGPLKVPTGQGAHVALSSEASPGGHAAGGG